MNSWNSDRCMARKNLTTLINVQCSYKQKYGDYCGIHKNKRLRIDEPLTPNLSNKNSSKPFKMGKLKEGKLLTIDDYHRSLHKVALSRDLKYTLNYYKLSTVGCKTDLITRLGHYFKTYSKYWYEMDKIIYLQYRIRKYLKQQRIKKHGIGLYKKQLCVNDYDFYTCESKNSIDDDYFISYQDDYGIIYWFDIRSLSKLMSYTQLSDDVINPFSTKPIPLLVLVNCMGMIQKLEKNNTFEPLPELKLTKSQQHNSKIFTIFQKLNFLDNYVNHEWFTILSNYKLRIFYHSLYDIWVHRANLTPEIRHRICPKGDPFTHSLHQISIINRKRKLQDICLDTIEKLIDTALVASDRVLGSMYVITALTDVSSECALAYPWLVMN